MGYDDYKFSRYFGINQESRWATVEEIKNAGHYINLEDDDCPVGGLPLMSNGKDVYVDDKDTHTLIFGSTGSKKSRLFCMPIINIFAKSGESFVVTDPKGELYNKTSGIVKSKGYKTIVLNFRDVGYGDCWNPLEVPYQLYHSENKELGISMLNDFVNTLAEPQRSTSKEPFWSDMASSLALANLLLLMEAADKSEVNLASLGKLCGAHCEKPLMELSERMSDETIAGMNYKGIFVAAENTKRSFYTSLYGMVRVFNIQKNLTRLLSSNTIDMRNIGREKTAVYLIVPDEKTTFHFLVSTFIKQVYEVLISEAQKEKDLRLPVRVNFVLDEFCNMPRVPDMASMISAARSRNMRYYLVAQSMHQLRNKYGEDAETIKGNCDNWVFLTSKELDLLNEISELCGTIRTADGKTRRLISVSELQRLDKQKGESLIIHARQYPFITEMTDIDQYEAFKGYEPVSLKPIQIFNDRMFPVHEFAERVKRGEIPCPFAKSDSSEAPNGIKIKKEKTITDSEDAFANKLKKWFSDSDTDTGDI